MFQFFAKWWAFFFPVDGWKGRYRAFCAGQKTWPVPGHPEAPKVVPFPVEWIPHRLYGPGEELDPPDGSPRRGFEFLDEVVCVDTGETVGKGVSVSCLRCGVHLHPSAAGMVGGFDPPKCKRCAPIIKFFA